MAESLTGQSCPRLPLGLSWVCWLLAGVSCELFLYPVFVTKTRLEVSKVCLV